MSDRAKSKLWSEPLNLHKLEQADQSVLSGVNRIQYLSILPYQMVSE